MIEPYEGQIFDPACGSGDMFCQSARFVKEHQGNVRDISIFGQESNTTTWKLAKMNLAIRQLEANLGKHNADSFHDDQHKTLKANYILANPPFNISDWGGEKLQDDVRWKYGVPPVGIEEQEDDGEPYEEKMQRLTSELSGMFAKSHELEEEIRKKLGAIGYEI